MEKQKPAERAGQKNEQDNVLAGKYLTFKLGGEEYGLEILKVREIIGLMDITPVPRSRHYIKGVINLRGKVIPVIDLRLKLGLDEKEYTDRTCIVVVETVEDEVTALVGVVVDSVSEVVNIQGGQIDTTFGLDSAVSSQYILGMAKTDSGLKILLDTDAALDGATSLDS